MSSETDSQVSAELKERFVDRSNSLIIGFAAIFILVASSSELWFSSDVSLFKELPNYPVNLIGLAAIFIMLFLLNCVDWQKRTRDDSLSKAACFAFLSTITESMLSFLWVMITYLSIGELHQMPIQEYWNLLYIALPVLLVELSLSSTVSRQLIEARELKRRAGEQEIEIQALVDRAKALKKRKERSKE